MYGKHFASMYSGSMVGAGLNVFAVWGYVIANTVKSRVELNPKLLAMILGCEEKEIIDAIAYLTKPDPQSRSKKYEGRRLVKEGQFQYFVPSHETYRRILNQDERRQYNRVKKAESRAQKKRNPPCQGMSRNVKEDVNDMSAMSAQAEAEAEEECSGTLGVHSVLDCDGTGVRTSTRACAREEVPLPPDIQETAFQVYGHLPEALGQWYRMFPAAWLPLAIERTRERGKSKPQYTLAILRDWWKKGAPDVEQEPKANKIEW